MENIYIEGNSFVFNVSCCWSLYSIKHFYVLDKWCAFREEELYFQFSLESLQERERERDMKDNTEVDFGDWIVRLQTQLMLF